MDERQQGIGPPRKRGYQTVKENKAELLQAILDKDWAKARGLLLLDVMRHSLGHKLKTSRAEREGYHQYLERWYLCANIITTQEKGSPSVLISREEATAENIVKILQPEKAEEPPIEKPKIDFTFTD